MDTVLIVKVISLLLYPLGLFFVLYLASWMLSTRWIKATLRCLAWFLLAMFSNPYLAEHLVENLESQNSYLEIEDMEQQDAILVLGGGLGLPLPPLSSPQLSGGSDRYWQATRLYKAGKSPRIVLSGGNVFAQPRMQGESYYAAELLQEWGVPESAISIESDSRTTEQNHKNIIEIIRDNDVGSVILVTSAYHLPRALENFKGSGLEITAFPTNIIVLNESRPLPLKLLPSVRALSLSTLAIHEYLGIWFIRLKRALGLL